jgi:hypothetical protein
MDATHHDKIVDKLLQYWGKMPVDKHLKTQTSKKALYITQMRIDDLVHAIEVLSNCLEIEGFE